MVFLEEYEINWRMLRVQKIIMLRLAEEEIPRLPLTNAERYSCNCMIGLLDYVQDQAKDTATSTAGSDIFTHIELREDFEAMGFEFDGNVDNALFHLVDERNEWLDAFVTLEKAQTQQKCIEEQTSIGPVRILTYEEWLAVSRPGGKPRPWHLEPLGEYEYYCPQCNRAWTTDELPKNLVCELHTFVPLMKRPRTPERERT
jgi:hypothetical protein